MIALLIIAAAWLCTAGTVGALIGRVFHALEDS
jgi:hypothetical protein